MTRLKSMSGYRPTPSDLPMVQERDARDTELAQLRQENAYLRAGWERAECRIDVLIDTVQSLVELND